MEATSKSGSLWDQYRLGGVGVAPTSHWTTRIWRPIGSFWHNQEAFPRKPWGDPTRPNLHQDTREPTKKTEKSVESETHARKRPHYPHHPNRMTRSWGSVCVCPPETHHRRIGVPSIVSGVPNVSSVRIV